MEHETIKGFTPWAIIISALIISLALYWNASTINGGLSNLRDSVDKIQINAAAPAANTGTTGQAQATAQAAAKTADLSFTSDAKLYPSEGSSNAKVTVTEFYDFQCPYCGMAYGKNYAAQYADLIGSEQKVRALEKSGDVKFVFATLAFLGNESVTAAQAAFCAGEQGKFIEMHDAIFNAQTPQEDSGKYSAANLSIIAKNVAGLDQAAFTKCFGSCTVEHASDCSYGQTLSQMNQNGFTSAGVQGTPTFYVNNVQSSGSWTELKAKLQAAGVQAS
ncbi:Thioredoxin [uncultured archaeon]|nr:Thioredoxin [uncultured archaeon]